MDDHLVHTKPNPTPPKLPKTFLQIILGVTVNGYSAEFSFVCFFFYAPLPGPVVASLNHLVGYWSIFVLFFGASGKFDVLLGYETLVAGAHGYHPVSLGF